MTLRGRADDQPVAELEALDRSSDSGHKVTKQSISSSLVAVARQLNLDEDPRRLRHERARVADRLQHSYRPSGPSRRPLKSAFSKRGFYTSSAVGISTQCSIASTRV
jgi:hypothetical protein